MSITESIDHQLASALEYSEVAYWSKLYDNRAALNCFGSVIAGAFAGAVPALDVLAMNRVLGLGMEVPVKAEDVESIIRFYEKAGSKRFFVQLSPWVQQQNLPELLQEKGFRYYNNWVKLLRPAAVMLPEISTPLEAVPVTPDQAATYGRIIYDSFDWEDERLIAWLAASVGRPGYHHYLVMHNDRPIAAGALHVMNHYASMALAGTLPEYRGLGAQSLLLKTRILQARQLGCDSIISETAEEKPDKPVASFRNMRRVGFEIAYLRRNWIFEF